MENKDLYDIYLADCPDYDVGHVRQAIYETVIEPGLLDFLHGNEKIGLKVNLVSAMHPDKAATTNPIIVKVIAEELIKRGCQVIVGDSPGNLYTENVLKNVYNETMMTIVEDVGAKLNDNFATEVVKVEGKIVKNLDTTSWLRQVDYIINICKLKSHGMMGLSCSVKNMFGSVPGITKPTYHYKYPSHEDFADMIVDINEYYKPVLNIVDAVIGMEGNGPTQGKPRKIGLILASKNPYNLDIICGKIIGVNLQEIPTIVSSINRGLTKKEEDIKLNKDLTPYLIKDFDNVKIGSDMSFNIKGGKIIRKIVKKILTIKPKVKKKECIGCKKCHNICPAKAIVMKNNKPVINRKTCIRCFCCQEFCPVGAMKASKTWIVRLLTK